MRTVLFVIGALLLVGALLTALSGGPVVAMIWLGVAGLILTLGVAFEHGRYKANLYRRPGPDWVATDERFLDPTNGEMVTVFYQPATGERRYVSAV